MANSMMRYTRHGLGREQGFTLLEALIAGVVLGVGLLAAYRFNSTTIAYSAESNVRAYAVALAESKLEELRNFQDSDDFDALIVDGNDAAVNYASSSLTRSWDRDEAYGNGDNPRKVDITVTWQDKLNDTQTVTLSSIIWRNNPGKDAKDLFLALNANGNSVDGYGNADGEVPEGHGGGKVEISPTYTDKDGEGNPLPELDPSKQKKYDVKFEGDVLFTDEGLEAITIQKDATSTHDAAWCEVYAGELHYTCYIQGIPDGEDWTGTLDFDPAGNNAVCEPSTQSIQLEPINQSTSLIEGLEVVVMKNFGSCPR